MIPFTNAIALGFLLMFFGMFLEGTYIQNYAVAIASLFASGALLAIGLAWPGRKHDE
jgi:hypothetical protein